MKPIYPDTPAALHRLLVRKGIDAPVCSVMSHYRLHTAPPSLLQAVISEYSGLPCYHPLLHGTADAPDVRVHCFRKRARHYLNIGAVPLAIRARRMIIGIVDPDTRRTPAVVNMSTGFTTEYVIITPNALEETVDAVFSAVCLRKATELLREKLPFYSACRIKKPRHRILAASSLMLLPLAVPVWDVSFLYTALYSVGAVCYTGAFGMKLAAFAAGCVNRRRVRPFPALADDALPVYSIMVPVYKEPDILPQLISALSRLDYPADKLDIVIIAEEDDTATRAAFADHPSPAYMRMIAVPPSQPRTKPKACNYVLPLLRGEYAVIYDAEDIPCPRQLREAAAAFAHGDARNVTYQAPLNFYNGDSNLLTRWFALEYAGHFEYMLRGISAIGLPLPLGGTSNHFNYDALTRAGGWDPFNVTEDADLGIRLYARRKQADVLSQVTMEEAPEDIRAWICQRSRWIKGHMQTALVHSRVSAATLPRIGWRRFIGMHAFLTLPIICYILAPFLLLLGGLHASVCMAELPMCARLPHRTPAEAVAAWWPLVYVTQCIISATAMRHTILRGGFRAWAAVALSPLYWVLHCVAAYKALWQLITKPFYWEKTTHGARFKVRV